MLISNFFCKCLLNLTNLRTVSINYNGALTSSYTSAIKSGTTITTVYLGSSITSLGTDTDLRA